MGHKWLESQVRELLSLWENNFKRLNGNRKNAPIYNEMAIQLNKKFNFNINGTDVNFKISNLKKQYRLEKKKKLSGGIPACWWAYNLVHNIVTCNFESDSVEEMPKELNFVDVSAPVHDNDNETAGTSGVGNIPHIDIKSEHDVKEEIEINEMSDINLNISPSNSAQCIKDKDEQSILNKRILGINCNGEEDQNEIQIKKRKLTEFNGDGERNKTEIQNKNRKLTESSKSQLSCDDEKSETEIQNKKSYLTEMKSKSKVSPSFRALLQYLDEDKAFREKELALREREIALREKEMAIRQANDDKFNKLIDTMSTYIQHKSFNSTLPNEDDGNCHSKRRTLDVICDGEVNSNENKKRKLSEVRLKSKVSSSLRTMLQYFDEERAFRDEERTFREEESAFRVQEICNRQASHDKFNTFVDLMNTYIEHQINKK